MPTVFNGFASSAGALLAGETSGLGIDFLASLPTLYAESSNTLMNYYGTPFTNDGGRVDFSRASLATTTDVDGKIKWSPHNLLLASEQLTSSPWGVNGVTVTPNSTAAPNGTLTADGITASGGNTLHYMQYVTTIAWPAAQHTFSVFAKNDTNRFLWISTYDGATNYNGVFDLLNGIYVGSVSGSGASTGSITAVGNGWFLCSITFTPAVGSTVYPAAIGTYNTGSLSSLTDSSTGRIFIWGASLSRTDLGGMQANGSAYPYYNSTTPKNLLGYTQDFNNAYWSKYAVAVPATKYADPFGGTTANLLYPTSATTDACLYKGGFPSVSKTHSYYVKSAGKSWVCILKEGTTGGAAWFNLSTGSVGTVAAGYTAPTPTSLGNGWYRCSVTSTSGFSQYTAIGAVDADNSTTPTPNGTDGIYLCGAQLSDSASLDPYSPVYGAAVTSAAYYGPRIDYDGVNLGTAKGLLIEEQRVNLIRYSRTLETTGSYWVSLTSGAANTITINNAPGPDGLSTSASLITYNTAVTGAGTYSVWRQLYTTTANGTYTFSVWLKAGTNTSVYIRLNDSGGNRATTLCNLTSSWQRFTVTGTTVASITVVGVDIGADGNVGGATMTSGTVYAYGAQLEAGSFSTSYIPTDASTVTRVADVASVGTGQFPYSSTEGTIVTAFNAMVVGVSTAAYAVVSISDGSGFNRIQNFADTFYTFYVVSGGTAQASIDAGTVSVNTVTKIGSAFATNDFAAVINGGTVGTDPSGTVPTVNTMYIGSGATGVERLNGHIRQITYIPRRLTNVELQQKTSA